MTRAPTIAPPETQLPDQPYRSTAVLALLGASLLAVGPWMHPAQADAGVPTESLLTGATHRRARSARRTARPSTRPPSDPEPS
jgi:hypothetical protein